MEFCEINFGVTFPMFAKVDVKGDHAEPLFTFLTSQKKGMLTEGIKWNFTKFLIDRKGNVVERFAPQTSPLKMKNAINQDYSVNNRNTFTYYYFLDSYCAADNLLIIFN